MTSERRKARRKREARNARRAAEKKAAKNDSASKPELRSSTSIPIDKNIDHAIDKHGGLETPQNPIPNTPSRLQNLISLLGGGASLLLWFLSVTTGGFFNFFSDQPIIQLGPWAVVSCAGIFYALKKGVGGYKQNKKSYCLAILACLLIVTFTVIAVRNRISRNLQAKSSLATPQPMRPPQFSISSGPILFTGTDIESLSAATIAHRRRHVFTVTNPNPLPLQNVGIVIQLPEPILGIKTLSQSEIKAWPDWIGQELKVLGELTNSFQIEPYGPNEPIGRWKVGLKTVPQNSEASIEVITADGPEGGWFSKSMESFITNRDKFIRWYIMADWSPEGNIPAAPIAMKLKGSARHIALQPLLFDAQKRSLDIERAVNLEMASNRVEMQIGKGFRVPGLFHADWYFMMHGPTYGVTGHEQVMAESEGKLLFVRIGSDRNLGEPVFYLGFRDGSALQIGARENRPQDIVWLTTFGVDNSKRATNSVEIK